MTLLKSFKSLVVRQAKRFGMTTPDDLESIREAIRQSERSHADWHQQIASLTSAVVQKASIAEMHLRLSRFQDALDELQRGLARSATSHPLSAQEQKANIGNSALSDTFYRALERHFRGSEADIRSRQQIYQPWFADLAGATVVDLGCGGGEWLGLLQEWGINAIGIDANGLNVESLKKSGRTVEQADAIDWLMAQPAASQSAITAFHVVEHLPADALLALLTQARRVLKPDGLLLLETPNPENILVATQTFWLDPTHIRPIPPPLLQFMVEFSGFRVDQVVRLNPLDQIDPAVAALGDAARVGRDYAVIARRSGDVTA